MKLKKVKIKNFRGYKDETTIDIDNLTAFVGKNDVGKSTILEALDIFFNDGSGIVKIEKNDINKMALENGDDEIIISVLFEDIPTELTIDATNLTNLKEEYLLNSNNQLEIVKKYKNANKAKVFIKAEHPTNENCEYLHQKKITELKRIVKDNKIQCTDLTKSAELRKSIWQHFASDLKLKEIEIDVSKEDAKNIWEKLSCYMPLYALFQSDRKNSDEDNEVQDPLKFAVKEIFKDEEIITKLKEVSEKVTKKLNDVSNGTLRELNRMNSEIADSLTPNIPDFENLKWNDVFKKVNISGDEGIPINKRGSGVKRLILISFFRAEAIRRKKEGNLTSIIYAIEEPETSQHFDHQKKLVQAFLELSETDNTQVLLTTHSSVIVKELGFDNIRLIVNDGESKNILSIEEEQLPYPSLNEVNCLALGEVTEEYHNELYGYIESCGELNNYKQGKSTMPYNRLMKNGNIQIEQKIKSEIIRHQIHHPENTHNERFSYEELKESIDDMRTFIQSI